MGHSMKDEKLLEVQSDDRGVRVSSSSWAGGVPPDKTCQLCGSSRQKKEGDFYIDIEKYRHCSQNFMSDKFAPYQSPSVQIFNGGTLKLKQSQYFHLHS